MPLRVGLLLYPLFIVAVAGKQTGVVSRFRKAGALDADTSRRPRSLGIEDSRLVQDEVRRGTLIAVGDGRYYLDLVAVRRVRGRALIVACIVAAVVIGGAIALYEVLVR